MSTKIMSGPICLMSLYGMTIFGSQRRNESHWLHPGTIGELVMNKLKDLDAVAYVRFASVYREFKDVNTFMDELKSVLNDKNHN